MDGKLHGICAVAASSLWRWTCWPVKSHMWGGRLGSGCPGASLLRKWGWPQGLQEAMRWSGQGLAPLCTQFSSMCFRHWMNALFATGNVGAINGSQIMWGIKWVWGTKGFNGFGASLTELIQPDRDKVSQRGSQVFSYLGGRRVQELLFDSQAEVGGGLGAFNAYLPRALSPSGDDYFLSVSQRLYSRKSKLGRIPTVWHVRGLHTWRWGWP